MKSNNFQFTNLSTGSNLVYTWNYGDGSSSNQKDGNKVYSSASNYNVSLYTTNNVTKCADTAILMVRVGEITDSGFSVNHLSTRSYTFTPNVQFYDKYFWDFGDQTGTSTQNTPTYFYPKPGSYEASLTIEHAGCTTKATKTVNATYDAISEIKGLEGIEVTPNPAHDRISIRFSLKQNRRLQISLMDALGRTTKLADNHHYTIGENQVNIDLNTKSIAPGTYFIVLHSENAKSTVKIILK